MDVVDCRVVLVLVAAGIVVRAVRVVVVDAVDGRVVLPVTRLVAAEIVVRVVRVVVTDAVDGRLVLLVTVRVPGGDRGGDSWDCGASSASCGDGSS